LAAPVAADEPTRGQIIVPADHVDPGSTFSVTGDDLDEEAPVRIELVRGDLHVGLGSATTAADGSLAVDLVMPSTFPTGYAELHVITVGASWSTTVLVGERAEGPGGIAGNDAAAGRLPAVLLLAGIAVLAFAVLRLVRGRRRAAP